MRIEKRYYDLAKSEWDEIAEEIRSEKEGLTAAEREIEEEKTKQELQEIYRLYEEHIKKWKRVPDKKRMQQFEELSVQALCVAKFLGCNIVVEDEDNSFGKITMEAESFVLPSLDDNFLNKTFSRLILWSDDVFISNSPSGLCKMEFVCHLYKEVRATHANK
ncbi:hypothetical protein ACTQ4E_12730 [Lawsonibacter sp. LCP25S3_G6]|uniref:hypothetical protein n=1 Tax=unclassified Lawsonibacter TaxID=2617946 RepID=UPI003F9B38B5